jgi:hypothetical protein
MSYLTSLQDCLCQLPSCKLTNSKMEKLCSDCTKALHDGIGTLAFLNDNGTDDGRSLSSFRQAIEDGCALCNILWGNLTNEDKSFFDNPEAKLTMQVHGGWPLPSNPRYRFSLTTSDMSFGWDKWCDFEILGTSSAGKPN